MADTEQSDNASAATSEPLAAMLDDSTPTEAAIVAMLDAAMPTEAEAVAMLDAAALGWTSPLTDT